MTETPSLQAALKGFLEGGFIFLSYREKGSVDLLTSLEKCVSIEGNGHNHREKGTIRTIRGTVAILDRLSVILERLPDKDDQTEAVQLVRNLAALALEKTPQSSFSHEISPN